MDHVQNFNVSILSFLVLSTEKLRSFVHYRYVLEGLSFILSSQKNLMTTIPSTYIIIETKRELEDI